MITPKELKTIEKIARETIPSLNNRPNLEPRHMDEEDFFETSVWSLKDALIAAYEAGKAVTLAEARPHAYWVKDGKDTWSGAHCSACRTHYTASKWGGRFCRGCGAEMLGTRDAVDETKEG